MLLSLFVPLKAPFVTHHPQNVTKTVLVEKHGR